MDLDKILGGKIKQLDVEDIRKMSSEEVEQKILQLQAHNQQLRCIISKQSQTKSQRNESSSQKAFDFTRFRKIHVLIKLLYMGWDYQGYVVQEDTSATVEHHLISALIKCKLIESRETSNYHRCGRTDKGVTAFSQVISVTVRAEAEDKPSLEYCKMLNRVLPEDIRALAWSPVQPQFSARFDCKQRSYRYFFPKEKLNLEAMNEAAQHLVGTHDFRNLCKMDVANGVTDFTRSVSSARVSYITDEEQIVKLCDNGYRMCNLMLEGQSFLWHQVRCIMSVLITVGQGLEKPSIVQELLDIKKHPRKPQYPMAHYIGLNLFACKFDSVSWVEDKNETRNVIETLQKIWSTNTIKAAHVASMLEHLESGLLEPVFKQCSGILKNECKQYKPILSRLTCNSLEERMEHCKKKRKFSAENETVNK